MEDGRVLDMEPHLGQTVDVEPHLGQTCVGPRANSSYPHGDNKNAREIGQCKKVQKVGFADADFDKVTREMWDARRGAMRPEMAKSKNWGSMYWQKWMETLRYITYRWVRRGLASRR